MHCPAFYIKTEKMNEIKNFFSGAKDGFREFSHTINNAVTFVLLLAVYIFGIGIVSIFSKLAGKHHLELKKTASKSSWHEHKVTKEPIEKYFRTF